MRVDLRIPVTEDQKKLITDGAAALQMDLAAWARPVLLNAAKNQIARAGSHPKDRSAKSPRRTKERTRAAQTPAPPWIAQAIELDGNGKSEQSLDLIFDRIDDLLLAGHFDECSSLLSSIPIDRMTNAQLLTALTATAPAKEKLPNRAMFYSQVQGALVDRGAEAEKLLAGLA